MAIPYRTAKFKSGNILAIAILGSTAKFNARQYFRLYGMIIILNHGSCVHAQGVKQSVVLSLLLFKIVVVVVISTKSAISRDVGIKGTLKHSQSIEFGEKLALVCVNNHQKWYYLSLAIVFTPNDSAYTQCIMHAIMLCAHVHN